MGFRADLHLHTTASDGRLTPTELVEAAVRQGLSIIAVTDHDSTEGIAEALEAQGKHQGLEVIPGVEVSADIPHTEVHILGYFVEWEGPRLCERLAALRVSRLDRAQAIVERLHELAVHIQWERVQELAGDAAVGRPHIAQAMLEGGYVQSLPEAFDRYLGRHGPAYVEREKLTPEEAVRLVIEAGGIAVLAHPGLTEGAAELSTSLKEHGLAGIEAYYGEYTPEQIQHWAQVARELDLIATGGSDYHAFGKENEVPLGGIEVPWEGVAALYDLAQRPLPKTAVR